MKRIRPEERVPVAYVMDAVVKDSRASNGDKDPFEGRFALRMTSVTLPILGDVPSRDRPLLYKLVKNWSQRKRFGLSDMDLTRLEEGWADETPSGLHSPNKALLSEEYQAPSHIHHHEVKQPETTSQSSSSDGNIATSVVRHHSYSPLPSAAIMTAQAVPSREVASDVASESERQLDLINLLEMSETTSRLPNDSYSSSGQTAGDGSFVGGGSWDSCESGRVMGRPTAMNTKIDSHMKNQQEQHRQLVGFPVEQKDQQKHLWKGGDQNQHHLQREKSQKMWLANERPPPWKCEQQKMRQPSSIHGQQAWQHQNNRSLICDPPLSSQLQKLPPHNQKQQQRWEQQQQKWPQTKAGEQMEDCTGQKMENQQPSGHKFETNQPKKRQRKSRSRWDQGPVTTPGSQPFSSSTIGKSRAENVPAATLPSSESLHTSPKRVCMPPPNVPFPPHLRPPSNRITGSKAPSRNGPSPQPTMGTSSSLQRDFPNGMAPLGPPPSTEVTSSSLSRGLPSGVHLGPGPPSPMKTVPSSLPREVPSGMQMHPGPLSPQPTPSTSLSKDYVAGGAVRSSHPLPAGLPVSSAMPSAIEPASFAGNNAMAVLPRGLPKDCSHPLPQAPPLEKQHQNMNGQEEIRFPLKDKLCRNISKNKPCSHGQNCHFSHSEDEIKAGFRIIRGGATVNGGSDGNSQPILGGNGSQGWGVGHEETVPPPRPPWFGIDSARHPRPPVLPFPPPHLRHFNVAVQSDGLPPPPSVDVLPGKVENPMGNTAWMSGSEVVRDPVQSKQTRLS